MALSSRGRAVIDGDIAPAIQTTQFIEKFDPERPYWVLGVAYVDARKVTHEEWHTFYGPRRAAQAADWIADCYDHGREVHMLLGETHWPIDRAPALADMKHQRYMGASANDSAGFMADSAPWAHTIYRSKNGRAVSILKLAQAIPASANKAPEHNYAAQCCTRTFQALPYCDWAPLPMSIRPWRAGGAIERLPGVTQLRQPSTALAVAPNSQAGRWGDGPIIDVTARRVGSDARADKLLGILRSHGVTATLLGVQQGPVVTVYMVTVPTSMKNSRVIGLADEIRRVMELPEGSSCRIAVIPGRDAIGIELPTTPRQTVKLSTVMESAAFRDPKLVLPLALGVTIDGKPVAADLARMPHLLIAGTTGSGKSVLMNAMIMSLIKTLGPDECKFILIDPKKLELTPYDGIPHLLMPVVTSVKEAVQALKWAVEEMDNRYTIISKARVRNIEAYNNKVRSGDVAGQVLPRIVIVIDEAAKLMRMAKDDVEFVVERLAAEARAAGIHLIMATQHPIVEIITTTIKANFPSRVALNVTNKRASGVILGEGMDEDASKLQGLGDMFVSLGEATPMRVHGAFVSDDEVTVETERLRAHGTPDYVVVGESDIKDEDAPVFDRGEVGERERAEVGTRRGDKIERATQWLLDRLYKKPPTPATALIEEGESANPPIISKTMRRAAARLEERGELKKSNQNPNGEWEFGLSELWSLP